MSPEFVSSTGVDVMATRRGFLQRGLMAGGAHGLAGGRMKSVGGSAMCGSVDTGQSPFR